MAELAKVTLKDGTESSGSAGQQGYQPDGFKINPLPAPSPVSAAPEPVSATAEVITSPATPASQSANTTAESITEPDMDAAGELDSVLGDI